MSISGGSNRILLDLNVHKVLATAATAAAAVSQELWTSGGALFQRAQEPNIPCGESLTSTSSWGTDAIHVLAPFFAIAGSQAQVHGALGA